LPDSNQGRWRSDMYDRQVLLEMETQRDFFVPGGSCYKPQALAVAARICRLISWAGRNEIAVISTALRVRRGQRGPMADVPHCVEDTDGERKLSRTILPRCINLGLRNVTDLPRDIFSHYRQVLFEKRDTDIFLHARIERLITELGSAAFIVCGAGVATGIVQAVIGLRSRGVGVTVAEDAILQLASEPAEMAMLRMEAKGALFVPTSKIIEAPGPRRPVRPFGITRCAHGRTPQRVKG